MGKDKQYWSVAETISLLKLWSSLRPHLDRATRTRESYEEIQRALATLGHEREMDQIVNKIKKLKMEFKEMSRSELDRDYWLKRNLYFDFLEKAFGSRGEGQGTESDEDGGMERVSADDVENLRKTVQENSCFQRICSTAEMHQSQRKPKDITEDVHDSTLKTEHRDQRHSPDQDTGGHVRTNTDLDIKGRTHGEDGEGSQPHTSVTVKTEDTEDLCLISSTTNTGPSSSNSNWYSAGSQGKDLRTTEPLKMSLEPAQSSSDFKIEYVVTEEDIISFSVPAPGHVTKMNNDKWQDAEVQALLSLYATKKMHQDFAAQKHNKRIFEKISHELANIGIHHTTKQCREKVKKLKQDYKKIKEINESGTEYKKSKWFNILDSILGQHPDYLVSAASENNSMEPLENIFSEPSMDRETTEEAVSESENNSSMQLSIDPVLSSSGLKIACVVSEAADCSSYPYFSPPVPMLKMSGDKWFDAEVKALLSLYATKELERDCEGQTNTRIYEGISSDLANIGINHSAKQCREKIKKLKQDYRKIKEHNNRYGAEIKTSKWYDILDSSLGHLPAYLGITGPMVDHSSMELLESNYVENSIDTIDSLGHLSKSAQIQPCFDRLPGSMVFGCGGITKPSQNCSSGKAEHNTEARESAEERVSESENPSKQLPFEPTFRTNNDKWHDAEVQAFLGIYATKKMQQDSEGQTRTKIFPGISRELAKIGIHRTARHCRVKIKKLKQDYRRIKSHNESGAQFKKGKWFNALDSILGHDPSYLMGSTVISDNSTEMVEENNVDLLESFGCLAKPCQDQSRSDGPLESALEASTTGSTLRPASPSAFSPAGNVAHGTIRTEVKEEPREESISEPEVNLLQDPRELQCPETTAVPRHAAVRSTAFRPAKRKRKENSELVECLERMHEQQMQHSRDMHEALLTRMDSHMTRMDSHMTTVIGLMGRMAAAMEAQAAKQPRPQ